MVDTSLNSLYRLLGCCWYSWQGPWWVGRRAEPRADPAGAEEQLMEATQVPGVLCREIMPESCTGAVSSRATLEHSVRYEPLGEEHEEEVMQLLVNSFFREEPLGLAAGVRTPEDVRHWLPAFVRPLAKAGLSSVAVEAESGRVVGVALCHLVEGHSHDSPLMAALQPQRDTKMMAVAQFLADLHLGVEEDAGSLSLLVLNVERHFSGRGIAAHLVRTTEERAKARGLNAVTADTTGEFSKKTFERLGYSVLRELKYEEYPGCTLRAGPVHTTARVMLKSI